MRARKDEQGLFLVTVSSHSHPKDPRETRKLAVGTVPAGVLSRLAQDDFPEAAKKTWQEGLKEAGDIGEAQSPQALLLKTLSS